MKTILIVEDDLSIQDTLQMILEWEGYRVVTAENGQEALEVLKSELPCLILLDLSMPIMNGFEFLEAQRSEDRIAAIPVLITSAEAELAKFEKVAGILNKPIHIEDLLTFVKLHCG